MKNRQAKADPIWRAALFQALAEGFHYPSEGHAERVLAALEPLIDTPDAHLAPVLGRALRQTHSHWRSASGETLEAEYSRLFLNQALCPLHETAYAGPGGVAGRTREIADISGFYLAFGLRTAEANADRPDHLCAELEFLSALLHLWARADAHGWREKREITARATRTFLADHLGRWHAAFAARLTANDAAPAYHALGELLTRAVAAECRIRGVRATRYDLEVGHDRMQEEDSLVCPRACAPAPEAGVTCAG